MLNLHDRTLPSSSTADDVHTSPRRQKSGHKDNSNKENPLPPKMVAKECSVPPKAGSPMVKPQERKSQSSQSSYLEEPEQETPDKFKSVGEATLFRENLGSVQFDLDAPYKTKAPLPFVQIDGVKLYSDEPHALTITSSPEEEETIRQMEAEFGNANIGIA